VRAVLSKKLGTKETWVIPRMKGECFTGLFPELFTEKGGIRFTGTAARLIKRLVHLPYSQYKLLGIGEPWCEILYSLW
jgi:hypothetical protein